MSSDENHIKARRKTLAGAFWLLNLGIILSGSLGLVSCKGEPKIENQLAMIMLRSSSSATIGSLQHQLDIDWPNQFKISTNGKEDKVFSFDSGELSYVVTELPAPIPATELEYPIETALLWKGAKEEIAAHKSHLLVYVTGKKGIIDVSKSLTKLISSVTKITDSIGVYWGDSAQVVRSDMFADFSDLLKNGSNPIPIWVKTTGYQNEDKSFYLYTVGLKKYGHREFEIEKYPGTYKEGISFLMDYADYVLTKGPVIKDGDTVGQSQTEKIRVKYKKSSLRPDDDVISILY